MLLALGLGFIVTFLFGLLIILALWLRNRKMPNFTPDQWRQEMYMRY